MTLPYIAAYLVFGILFAESSQRLSRQRMRPQDEVGVWLIYTIIILAWPLFFLFGIVLVMIEELKK